MPLSERVQAARKKSQQLRLVAKTKKGYVDTTNKDGTLKSLGYHNSQPQQKVLHAAGVALNEARADLALSVEDLAVAEIDGVGLEAAQTAVQVNALIVQNMEAAKNVRRGVSLTNAALGVK